MNRYLIVSGIAVLLICIGLSGCNESSENNEENRFVGTWKVTKHFHPDNSLDVEFTYYNNDTAKTVSNYTMGDIQIQWFNYEIDNSQLCLIPRGLAESYAICYNYDFSDNYKTLTLTDESSNTSVLTKQ